MNWLEFECLIMDRCETEGIHTKREAEMFAEDLHSHIEIAMQDYCDDEGIDDYEPYC